MPSSDSIAPAPASGEIRTESLAKVYGKREVVHDVSLSVGAASVGRCWSVS